MQSTCLVPTVSPDRWDDREPILFLLKDEPGGFIVEDRCNREGVCWYRACFLLEGKLYSFSQPIGNAETITERDFQYHRRIAYRKALGVLAKLLREA